VVGWLCGAQVSMFMHFSMCTFAPKGGCEQDTACRTNPPSLFDPDDVNTTQWMETAAAMGAKEVCLTAHHTGGFALFPSNFTNYTIARSPYKGGHGDIVQAFTASARQFGISPCLYFINAWDCWESEDSPDLYLEKTLGMLTELSNRERYGKIDRFWFDQYGFSSRAGEAPKGLFPAAWDKIVEHVHKVSPVSQVLNAVVDTRHLLSLLCCALLHLLLRRPLVVSSLPALARASAIMLTR
jgi:alpha-L-fucosidase